MEDLCGKLVACNKFSGCASKNLNRDKFGSPLLPQVCNAQQMCVAVIHLAAAVFRQGGVHVFLHFPFNASRADALVAVRGEQIDSVHMSWLVFQHLLHVGRLDYS